MNRHSSTNAKPVGSISLNSNPGGQGSRAVMYHQAAAVAAAQQKQASQAQAAAAAQQQQQQQQHHQSQNRHSSGMPAGTQQQQLPVSSVSNSGQAGQAMAYHQVAAQQAAANQQQQQQQQHFSMPQNHPFPHPAAAYGIHHGSPFLSQNSHQPGNQPSPALTLSASNISSVHLHHGGGPGQPRPQFPGQGVQFFQVYNPYHQQMYYNPMAHVTNQGNVVGHHGQGPNQNQSGGGRMPPQHGHPMPSQSPHGNPGMVINPATPAFQPRNVMNAPDQQQQQQSAPHPQMVNQAMNPGMVNAPPVGVVPVGVPGAVPGVPLPPNVQIPGGPPGAMVAPVIPAVPVSTTWQKRKRTVALIQDPDTLEVVNLPEESATSRASSVAPDSARSNAATPSSSSGSNVPVASSGTDATTTSNSTSNANVDSSKTTKPAHSKESSNEESKTSPVASDVALEFMTKVASLSVNEPVISKSAAATKQQPIVTETPATTDASSNISKNKTEQVAPSSNVNSGAVNYAKKAATLPVQQIKSVVQSPAAAPSVAAVTSSSSNETTAVAKSTNSNPTHAGNVTVAQSVTAKVAHQENNKQATVSPAGPTTSSSKNADSTTNVPSTNHNAVTSSSPSSSYDEHDGCALSKNDLISSVKADSKSQSAATPKSEQQMGGKASKVTSGAPDALVAEKVVTSTTTSKVSTADVPPKPPRTSSMPKANSTGNLPDLSSSKVSNSYPVGPSDGAKLVNGDVTTSTTVMSVSGLDNNSSSSGSGGVISGVAKKSLPAIPEVSSAANKASDGSSSPSSEATSPILVNKLSPSPSPSLPSSKKSSSQVDPASKEVTSTTLDTIEDDENSNVVVEEAVIEDGEVLEAEEEPEEEDLDNFEKYRDSNGHWHYDHSDLLQFHSVPLSLERPPFDASMDSKRPTIILPECRHQRDYFANRDSPQGGNRGDNNNDMFTPSWMVHQMPHGGNRRSGNQMGSGSSGGQGSGNRRGNAPAYGGRPSQERKAQIVIQLPTLTAVELHKTDKAWKPGGLSKSLEELDAEEKVTLELIKSFRGILNKITPQKYETLLERIKALNIDTEDRLSRILDLVFDKAVDEPKFCEQYAELCKHLSSLTVDKVINDETGEKEQVKFQRLLLMKCQKEFERDVYENIDVQAKEKMIEEESDPDKKKQLTAEFEEEKRLARKRSLGINKLVGELYRLKMLKGGIMINCMHSLISDIEEENLECLCTLMRTIGGQLEAERKADNKNDLQPYFDRLEQIVQQKTAKKVGARVRFLIKDILELRQRGWIERERQATNQPKKITEIHAEAEQDERRNAHEHMLYQNDPMRAGNRNRNDPNNRARYGGRQSSPAAIGGGNRGRPGEIADVIKCLKDTMTPSDQGLNQTKFGGIGSYRWNTGSGQPSSAGSSGMSTMSTSSSSTVSQVSRATPSSSPLHQSSSSGANLASSGGSGSNRQTPEPRSTPTNLLTTSSNLEQQSSSSRAGSSSRSSSTGGNNRANTETPPAANLNESSVK